MTRLRTRTLEDARRRKAARERRAKFKADMEALAREWQRRDALMSIYWPNAERFDRPPWWRRLFAAFGYD